jgi:hypothetical protein
MIYHDLYLMFYYFIRCFWIFPMADEISRFSPVVIGSTRKFLVNILHDTWKTTWSSLIPLPSGKQT